MALSISSGMCQTLPANIQECISSLEPLYTNNCAADYAVAAVTAVEFAWCMKDKTKYKDVKISAQDIICNCADCHNQRGNGCMGGKVVNVLKYMRDGLAVGGSNDKAAVNVARTFDLAGPQNYHDCLNYFRPFCDPEVEKDCYTKAFNPDPAATPANPNPHCPLSCNRKTGQTVALSRITKLVLQEQSRSDAATMATSLGVNKPLISTMEIFEDMEFFLGTDQVYVHSSGQSLGVVNVVIVGHSNDSVSGLDYWIVLVPWDQKYEVTNKSKGNTIRVLKGVNHCGIETLAYEINV